MKRTILMAGAVAVGLGLTLPGLADAQTVYRHVRHPAAVSTGREIIVRPGPSYLSLGTGADVGAFHSYVLDTVSPQNHMPMIDGTFLGQRGLIRLPNNLTVPGCCAP